MEYNQFCVDGCGKFACFHEDLSVVHNCVFCGVPMSDSQEKKVEVSPPVEITRDLVNSIRLEGRSHDADMLVQAHLKSIKDEKKQLKKELERDARRIKKFLYVKDNLCFNCKSPLLSSVYQCYYCKKKKCMVDKVYRLCRELVSETNVEVHLVVKALYKEHKKNIVKYNNKIHKRVIKKQLEGVKNE